jgi:hypothetical protein
MTYGNTRQAFNLVQNIGVVQGVKIFFHSLTAQFLHMTANAFFDSLSHLGVTRPGKTKPIKELSE